MSKLIYLDSNATTIMPEEVIKNMLKWCNKGNPSADYASAKSCQQLIEKTREDISELCGITQKKLTDKAKPTKLRQSDYKIIFTSGASEANTLIIQSCILSYLTQKKATPHIIISAIEHKSILSLVDQFEAAGLCEATRIPPSNLGFISAADVGSAIIANTCLISIMAANNETGAINNIKAIGTLSHKHKIPFHTDAVQYFKEFPLKLNTNHIDAATICAHKLHGPVGIGALIVREQLIADYQLKPLIAGTQNDGMRGGTENTPAIAGFREALKYNFSNRKAKNDHIADSKQQIIDGLCARGVPCQTIIEYYEGKSNKQLNALEIVFVSMATGDYLANTLMLSVVKRTLPEFCNSKMKKILEKNNVIVSIGSACNTASPKASHVLTAMTVDAVLRKGILRISMPDNITADDIKNFIELFIKSLKETLILIDKENKSGKK